MALPILDGNQTATTLSTVLTSGEHIPAHTVVSLGSQAITDVRSAVSGSVVSISNFPSTQTIAGAVTGNIGNAANIFGNGYQDFFGMLDDGQVNFNAIQPYASNLNATVVGTVTANAGGILADAIEVVNDSGNVGHKVAVQLYNPNGLVVGDTNNPLRISGTVTIGSLPAISGTVTANNPSGALTTRFGSVTTANLAFITSAVTNASRKYLLAQNISTGAVTIGIGFSPTTTQGIQLAAGGGLTFDAFCPTGAVYWLGAVTGAAFTILEG